MRPVSIVLVIDVFEGGYFDMSSGLPNGSLVINLALGVPDLGVVRSANFSLDGLFRNPGQMELRTCVDIHVVLQTCSRQLIRSQNEGP